MDKAELNAIEKELTERLLELRNQALKNASIIVGRDVTLQSLNAKIGGKNNEFVDSINTQFRDFDDFFSRWLRGLRKEIEIKEKKSMHWTGEIKRDSVYHQLAQFFHDDILLEYVELLLKRNFYRNYFPRKRAKPIQELWDVWFGNNDLFWGIFLAPQFREGTWKNHRGSIRRAQFNYWTIGHILETGIIDPNSKVPYKFSNIDSLLSFYESVLKRVSNSIYEKEIASEYVKYIKESQDALNEPFLIPELRYAGLGNKHTYRLDYSVLNSYTMDFIGFELSPHSTHMAISGIKSKTQRKLNEELSKKWEKEMHKRNNYFLKFEIPVVTFTDHDLKDIPQCFKTIEKYLKQRAEKEYSVQKEFAHILNYEYVR